MIKYVPEDTSVCICELAQSKRRKPAIIAELDLIYNVG